MSGGKVAWLNAARSKFWDLISALTYSKEVTLQPRACK